MYRRYWLFALTATALLTACQQDEEAGALLEPLVVPASVVSETVAEDQADAPVDLWSWTEGDRVALVVNGETKVYEASTANGGQLMASVDVEPFYWTRATQTMTVKGWYKGNAQNAAETHEMPTSWTVIGDQNANSGAGYAQSELLYASPTAVARDPENKFRQKIFFYHQTAKIIIRVKNSGVMATNPEVLTAVTIGDATYPIAMKATWTEPETGNFGTWTPDHTQTGYIKPHQTALDDTENYVLRYEALLIPQDLDHTPLLAFVINGTSFYYNPGGGQAEFQPGYQFIYDIEISQESIVVTPVFGGNLKWTWDEQPHGVTSTSMDIAPWLSDARWTKYGNDIAVRAGEIPITFADGWWLRASEPEDVTSNVGDGPVTTPDAEWEQGSSSDVDSGDGSVPRTTNDPEWEQSGDDIPVTSHESNT